MPTATPNLGLVKPDVGNTNWSEPYYDAMDTLDAHPGTLLVDSDGSRPSDPYEGQVISRTDQPGLLEQWAGGQWNSVAGEPVDEPIVYDQPTPISTVVIPHNKPYYPQVEIIDPVSKGRIQAGVSFPTSSTVQITFLQPRSFVATIT